MLLETRCNEAHKRKTARYTDLFIGIVQREKMDDLAVTYRNRNYMVPSSVIVETFDCSGNGSYRQVENGQVTLPHCKPWPYKLSMTP